MYSNAESWTAIDEQALGYLDMGTQFPTTLRFDGDYYSEDPVERGLCLGLADLKPREDLCPLNDVRCKHGQEFFDAQAPEEPLDGTCCTTVALEASAAEAAARVCKFLESQAASIKKCNPHKFSIIADTFCETCGHLAYCSLKVRIYKRLCGSLVEFTRRSGDAVAFRNIFQQAGAFLKGSRKVPLETPVVLGKMAMERGSLEALIQMATNGASPWLQAEALASLMGIARAAVPDAADRTMLSDIARGVLTEIASGVEVVLQVLWCNPRLDIAYPAACLANILAQHGVYECPPRSLSVVTSDQMSELVRQELASAIRATCSVVGGKCRSVPRADLLSKAFGFALETALRCARAEDIAEPLSAALSSLKAITGGHEASTQNIRSSFV